MIPLIEFISAIFDRDIYAQVPYRISRVLNIRIDDGIVILGGRSAPQK